VLSGTLTMYLGDPPQRQDVPAGGLIHVEPGTPLQTANHGNEDLLVYAYGTPPEDEHAEILDSAISHQPDGQPGTNNPAKLTSTVM
jgi:mannose-6-phosphate isomerase-like protein (cupin superfamily)